MQQPGNPADDPPPENRGTSTDPMVPKPKIAKPPSPTKPLKSDTEEVVITGASFQEPGNPVALAKHSAKEELVERSKVKFHMANYSHLSISEIFSGYMNQIHGNHELEIDMVKHMHQKHEVLIPALVCDTFL